MCDEKTISDFVSLTLLVLALILGLSSVAPATEGDLNGDGSVDWADLSIFAEKWLHNASSGHDWSGGTDFDLSQDIDLVDFALWAQYWSTTNVYAIAYDPYQDVDWDLWHRALAQHHDHMGRLSLDRIKAYDEAGYNVIVPLDYAGRRSGGTTYCDYRLWPVHEYLSGFNSDEEVLATLNNIKLFVPSMEEIGCHHMTSPFLTTYIELWEPNYCETKEQWHYETSQQCMDLINLYGGMAIIAHPTASTDTYMELENYHGIEIVNGYFYCRWLLKEEYPDYPNYTEHFQLVWDHLLTNKDTKIWGFAVNDWYGPWEHRDEPYDAPYMDCGKILVMIPAYSMDEYRNSLEKGCFFAIHDWGEGKNKNRYPKIAKIMASNDSIAIDTDGGVSWIANGERVAEGNAIDLTELPSGKDYKYVRAEISNGYGIVFTQPWALASLGQ